MFFTKYTSAKQLLGFSKIATVSAYSLRNKIAFKETLKYGLMFSNHHAKRFTIVRKNYGSTLFLCLPIFKRLSLFSIFYFFGKFFRKLKLGSMF